MALASNALTTLATAKSELQLTGSCDDSYLERLINAASDFVEQYTGRSFYNEAAKVEKVAGYATAFLTVSKSPLNSIASITFDGETVAAADYEIHNAGAGMIWKRGGWVWTAPRRQDITDPPLPGYERRLYQVTYDGGYITPNQVGTRDLPYDLEDAALRLVAMRYRQRGRDPSIVSERLLSWSASYDKGSGGSETAPGIPPDVVSILDRYKQPTTS